MSSPRAFNFNAGPAFIPDEVIQIAQRDLYDFRNSGMGILEISHRSALFESVLNETSQALRDALEIPANYEILFCTGGGTQQFSMVPLNFVTEGTEGNYLLTGVWAEKSYLEAKRLRSVHVAGSSKETKFSAIPKTVSLSKNPAYLHFTSNNTVVGTQFRKEPEVGNVPLICDASSDILSRKIDVSKYGLIYACAQKNLGPVGVTVVIVRSDLLARSPKDLPILLDYNTYAENKSLYNTVPTFGVYLIGEILNWVKRHGGVSGIEKHNEAKAKVVYDVLDRLPFYRGHAEKADRSLMNVSFFCPTPELDAKFVAGAEARRLKGLKGHSMLNGIRASIYNAAPIESVQALASYMEEFASENK